MKNLFITLLLIGIAFPALLAQSPDSFRYQTVVRDNNGNIRQNDALSMRLSILQGTETGVEVYKETHATTTNEFGLVNLSVGTGTIVTGTFATINWGTNPYFLKVEMDTTAGSNYVLMGTSQLLSVPYALNAKNGTPPGQNPGDMLYWNGTQWVNVPAGSNGQVLTINNGVPTWSSGGNQLPISNTDEVSAISSTTAICSRTVISAGIINSGVCYGTSPYPTIINSNYIVGSENHNSNMYILGLTPNTTYFVRTYATNSIGTGYGNELTFTTLPSCGSMTINHVAGVLAPVNKTVTYNTVTNIPGETAKCWITSNLGADHQATSPDDATEASAGWYWQFNRKQGYKHDGIARTPNTTWIDPINETSDWITANDPCTIELGAGWRIPTNTEWTNVDASGNWTDRNGPWISGLKLHAAGYLISGALNNRGSYGYYWSSVQGSATAGWNLYFHSSTSYMSNDDKATGFSVRCLRDN
jgi:hypothetical protein